MNQPQKEIDLKREIPEPEMNKTQEFSQFVTPLVDIFEDEEKLTILADLPGVKRENLTLNLEKKILSFEGSLHWDENKKKILHQENTQKGFRRVFTLGNEIDQEKITASLENGVLEIRLFKKGSQISRKIEIN